MAGSLLIDVLKTVAPSAVDLVVKLQANKLKTNELLIVMVAQMTEHEIKSQDRHKEDCQQLQDLKAELVKKGVI